MVLAGENEISTNVGSIDSANNSVNDNTNGNTNGNTNDNEPSHQEINSLLSSLGRILSLMASPVMDETGATKSVVAGLLTVFASGTCLGMIAPGNEILTPFYRKISAAIGYIYFTAWSISFYPQVISNSKRKSTVGLSTDFVVLNVIGFGCYAAYNAAFFWSPVIQKLYREKYGPDAEITVQSNDVAFAIHALVLSLLTLGQILWYNKLKVRLSWPIPFVILGTTVVCIGYPLLVMLEKHQKGDDRNFEADNDGGDAMGRFNWLGYLYVLSYVKIFISVIKYIPQVILNFQRKSTAGWSIWNILLDFTGGTLSDLQLVLDCADLKDFSGITHNKPKFALGSLSIVFDLVFLFQHYFLYRDTAATTAGTTEASEPLLPHTDTEGGTEDGGDEQSSSSSSMGPRTIFV